MRILPTQTHPWEVPRPLFCSDLSSICQLSLVIVGVLFSLQKFWLRFTHNSFFYSVFTATFLIVSYFKCVIDNTPRSHQLQNALLIFLLLFLCVKEPHLFNLQKTSCFSFFERYPPASSFSPQGHAAISYGSSLKHMEALACVEVVVWNVFWVSLIFRWLALSCQKSAVPFSCNPTLENYLTVRLQPFKHFFHTGQVCTRFPSKPLCSWYHYIILFFQNLLLRRTIFLLKYARSSLASWQ